LPNQFKPNILKGRNLLHFRRHDENMKLSTSKLTNDQVKASQIYGRLQERISAMEEAQIIFDQEHARVLI
jgi:hypothetical protein